MRISERAERIEPFWVMEVAKAASQKAREVAHTERPVVFLNIGEPDFTAPPLVQAAAQRAIAQGHSQYTQATGLPALRERISAWYASRFGVNVPASRIVVTAGASAALQLAEQLNARAPNVLASIKDLINEGKVKLTSIGFAEEWSDAVDYEKSYAFIENGKLHVVVYGLSSDRDSVESYFRKTLDSYIDREYGEFFETEPGCPICMIVMKNGTKKIV